MEHARRGFTLIELLVIVTIIGVLATIVVGVYTGSVRRARVSAAYADIHQISVAVETYRIDTGKFPHSSTGTLISPDYPLNPDLNGVGCGYMTLALTSSLNADPWRPLHAAWNGPYIDLDREQLGTLDGSPVAGHPPAELQMLDPWGTPYRYVRFDHYVAMNGTRLPATDPFAATAVYYKVSTFQIVSYGPDAQTNPAPNIGLAEDDLTNFTR